jgi:integrase/recombinase XerD
MPAAHPVPGDPTDPDGMPALVEGFCEWLAVRGYSRTTIDRYHVSLFADWAVARGIEQPREVTRPVVERYQRALFHFRQPNGRPLTFRSQTARLVALR